MSRRRVSLGVYAPRPGAQSGLAGYAADSNRQIADVFEPFVVSLENHLGPWSFGRVLYHMSGGRDSVAAFRASEIRPGPMILHEHVLTQFFVDNHDLLDEPINELVRAAVGAALNRTFRSSAELAGVFARERHLYYLDLGLERLAIERATVVFTHSRHSLRLLRNRHPDVRFEPLDFPVRPLPAARRRAMRRKLNIPQSAVVFGSFGFTGRHKRMPRLLSAWRSLHLPDERAQLLVVGRGASDLTGDQDDPGIKTLDYIPSREKYETVMATVDVGVQLRGPTLGETSGVVAQLLASDVPVITSSESVLPLWANEELVDVVPMGEREVPRLRRALLDHVRRPGTTGHGRRWSGPTWRESILPALGAADVNLPIQERR